MEVQSINERLIARPYRADDVSRLYDAVRESVAEISPWLSWCDWNYSMEESSEFIASRVQAAKNDEWYSFGVFERDTERLVGGVGLNFINRVHQMGNLGYWVRTSETGRGIATEAAAHDGEFCF